MTIRRARTVSVLMTFLILGVGWFAAPLARQDKATKEFILFTTDRDNLLLTLCPTCVEEIYVMEPDGSGATRLTFTVGNDGGADWSRERETIVFHSNRRQPLGRPEIFLMNLDGTGQRLLASLGATGAAFPSFSYNGSEICFQSQTAPRDIYIVDIHGTGLTNLTSPEKPGGAGDNLRCDWSPKSNEIAFVSTRNDNDQEIYVINADGSKLDRLTTQPGRDANPAWSPDGKQIAFESNRNGNGDIYVMTANGKDPIGLTSGLETDSKPSWSPDGDRIAFHRQIGEHLQVFTMNADGSDVKQITSTPAPWTSGFPSWGKSKSEF